MERKKVRCTSWDLHLVRALICSMQGARPKVVFADKDLPDLLLGIGSLERSSAVRRALLRGWISRSSRGLRLTKAGRQKVLEILFENTNIKTFGGCRRR